MSIEINDNRVLKDFKGITFSKFKKSEARKELISCILNNKIESSCFWCGEFICSGHFLDLWDIILYVMSYNIHLANPKLPKYLDMRKDIFINIINSGYDDNKLLLRNNNKIRRLFAEIMCVLCLSKKFNKYNVPKIKDNEYIIGNIGNLLEADNITYAQNIYSKDDPKELFVCINEFVWNLKKKNMYKCCYWLEWLLGYEMKCIKNKLKYTAARRAMPVDNIYQKDIIWIIWQILLNESNIINNGTNTIIMSLLNLFCLQYKSTYKRKRKYIIYNALSLITQFYNTNIKILNDNKIVNNVLNNINIVYKQIKKNEIKSKTDYLFNNNLMDKRKNLEKTLKRLDIMNKFNKI